jgi:hypothetical protein
MSSASWLVIGTGLLFAAGPPARDPDAQLLRRQGVKTDRASLLRFLRERTPDDKDRVRVAELVHELGGDEFDQREDAQGRLVRLGALAEPALRKGLKSKDREIQRRAAVCLKRIAQARVTPETVSAVVRRLQRLGGKGTVAALLAYLPSARDELVQEAIYFALLAQAEKRGRIAPEVLAACSDRAWQRRAAAACIGMSRRKYGCERRRVCSPAKIRQGWPLWRYSWRGRRCQSRGRPKSCCGTAQE